MGEDQPLPRPAEGDRPSRRRSPPGDPGAGTRGALRSRRRGGASARTATGRVTARRSTGREIPLSRTEPRSSKRMSSRAPARCTSSDVTRISPDRARAQSRAARFSARPRYPSPRGTASPASIPIPTPSGTSALSSLASAAWRSSAARIASRAESKTARISSPRTSTIVPVRDSIPLLADRDESVCEGGRRFVASGVAEVRVPAQIGDQERADHRRGRVRERCPSCLGLGVHRALQPTVRTIRSLDYRRRLRS